LVASLLEAYGSPPRKPVSQSLWTDCISDGVLPGPRATAIQ
jgi:hypothetical protein